MRCCFCYIEGLFPGACGLEYNNDQGLCVGVLARGEDQVFDVPLAGWFYAGRIYNVVYDELKIVTLQQPSPGNVASSEASGVDVDSAENVPSTSKSTSGKCEIICIEQLLAKFYF